MNHFLKGWNRPANDAQQPLETTVTFLEMTSQPSHRVQPPANLRLALLRAHKPTPHFYRYLYFHVGNQFNWEMRLRLNDAALLEKIHAPKTEIHVLYLDGVPAGFYEINRANPAVTDLAYFGIMGHAIGLKLGKWFLSAAIHACWENGPDKITVNTCTLDHPAALPLYQKMGFVPVRRAKGRVTPLADSERAALAIREGLGP